MSEQSVLTARREAQKALVKPLWQLRDRVHALRQHTLNDSKLAELGIRKLAALDVDESAPFDPEPLFFQPYRVSDGEDFHATVVNAQYRREPKRWTPMCTNDESDREWCARFRSNWFTCSLGRSGAGILGTTEWESPSATFCDDDTEHCSRDPGISFQYFDPLDHIYNIIYSFSTGGVFRVANDRKSHIAALLYDSGARESETLGSEVMAALTALMYRYRHGKFGDHHTIPVLIYCLLGDQFGRLTQAYWDGTALVIRQSRLFDWSGDEPTDDAYLFLRWMANRPVGETQYRLGPDEVVDDGAGCSQPLRSTSTLAVQA